MNVSHRHWTSIYLPIIQDSTQVKPSRGWIPLGTLHRHDITFGTRSHATSCTTFPTLFFWPICTPPTVLPNVDLVVNCIAHVPVSATTLPIMKGRTVYLVVLNQSGWLSATMTRAEMEGQALRLPEKVRGGVFDSNVCRNCEAQG